MLSISHLSLRRRVGSHNVSTRGASASRVPPPPLAAHGGCRDGLKRPGDLVGVNRRPSLGPAPPVLISGTVRPDVIVGGGGDDELAADGGTVEIWSEPGADRIYGAARGDRVLSGRRRDRGLGGTGNCRLGGGQNRERLLGETRDDCFVGGARSDQLNGGQDPAQADRDICGATQRADEAEEGELLAGRVR